MNGSWENLSLVRREMDRTTKMVCYVQNFISFVKSTFHNACQDDKACPELMLSGLSAG